MSSNPTGEKYLHNMQTIHASHDPSRKQQSSSQGWNFGSTGPIESRRVMVKMLMGMQTLQYRDC